MGKNTLVDRADAVVVLPDITTLAHKILADASVALHDALDVSWIPLRTTLPGNDASSWKHAGPLLVRTLRSRPF